MVEFYKLFAEYRADIKHEKTDEMIDFRARVYLGPPNDNFTIRYSHTYAGQEGRSFYYSNSQTRADTAEEAEATVRRWARSIAGSDRYQGWTEEL
ncbi:hypothetical protein [Sulfitobacter sp. CW3]|uniref:hypothetical protein n=1 Tax=Sulfitobacter sp. CW3 TaxID=2861965 RepID=UPI001C5F88F7|nr:hypothetical protein [Sulfitobacter sp. CW3]MBW4961896.1 hypothetical protein [Sulfitobacter sp. CW3]